MKYYNEYEFCENYVETMYHMLTLKIDEINTIEHSREDMLTEAYKIADVNRRNFEIESINQSCDTMIIELLIELKSEFPELFKVGFNRLYDILTRYSDYAKRFNMKVPQSNSNLTISDYYGNYKKALQNIERIKSVKTK